jgi:hypothetical protein
MHDIKRDGHNFFGGGFIDDQIGPGLHFIKAFSNTSPFVTSESAAKTFQYRADQLCPNGFTEVRKIVSAYQSSTPNMPVPIKGVGLIDTPKSVITSKIGHVLCNDSPISLYEAKMLVTPENE